MNIRDLFRNNATVVNTPVTTKAGDHVKLRSRNNDPFPPKKTAGATVLDVRGGWVRYRIGDGNLFDDERMELKLFEQIYEHAP